VIDWPESTQPFYDAMSPAQQRAATLVYIANAAADPAFKSRYARRWWGLLEERAKLCAMTSPDLLRWSSSMAARLGGDLARNAAHREAWRAAVTAPDPGLVLDALQHDTPVLLAFVRAVSEAKRDQWEAEAQAERDPAGLTDAQQALL
jgi:hypothetical protein